MMTSEPTQTDVRKARCTVGLPFEDWPAGDRALWDRMFPEDIDDRYERFQGTPPTDRSVGNIRQLLCRVAGFYDRELKGLLGEPFIERFDEDTVVLLVEDLAETCQNATIRDYLKELKRYLVRSGGRVNVGFDRTLKDLARNIPSDPRQPFPISAQQVAERATAYMTKALADLEEDLGGSRTYNAPERFRNGFIILFLIKRPLRVKNLSELVLHETFLVGRQSFEVRFPGDMMKNGNPYSSTFGPGEANLFEATCCYIERVLPCFADGDGLFRSRQGGRLTPSGFYQIITDITKDVLDIRLTPHDFRRVFTDSAIASGKQLSDINHACQRRPGSETVYDYKTENSANASRVVRPMLEGKLAALIRQQTSRI